MTSRLSWFVGLSSLALSVALGCSSGARGADSFTQTDAEPDASAGLNWFNDAGAVDDAGRTLDGSLADDGSGADAHPPKASRHVKITFDELTAGTDVKSQYAPDAVFTAEAGSTTMVLAYPYGSAQPSYICPTPSFNAGCYQDTSISFGKPVRGLRFNAVGVDNVGKIATVRVFVGATLARTVDVIHKGSLADPASVDLSSIVDITRVELVNITDAAGVGWDDFEFDVEK